MNNLIVAALFLIGTHLGIASSQLRTALVQRLGERLYLALYSLLALLAIGWLVSAWRQAPLVPLWTPGPALAHLPLVLMPLALLLVVCGLTGPNPTAVGQRPDPDAQQPATGILRVTRHPFMWGAGLWASAHLLVNGDQASVIFFGTFAVLALLGTVLLDSKRTRNPPPGWGVFLQATSNVPLAAILQRRQRFVPREIGLTRVAATLGLYVLLLWLHPWLFGVSPLP
jgi:uncharacterized membrane protein